MDQNPEWLSPSHHECAYTRHGEQAVPWTASLSGCGLRDLRVSSLYDISRPYLVLGCYDSTGDLDGPPWSGIGMVLHLVCLVGMAVVSRARITEMNKPRPNHSLQRIPIRSRDGNQRASWSPSPGLGRWPHATHR